MTGGDAPRSGPSWEELRDALYLAACQDNAAPYRQWRDERSAPPPQPAGPPARDPGPHAAGRAPEGADREAPGTDNPPGTTPSGPPEGPLRTPGTKAPGTKEDPAHGAGAGESTGTDPLGLADLLGPDAALRPVDGPGPAHGSPAPAPRTGETLAPGPFVRHPPWDVLRPDAGDPGAAAGPLEESRALARALRPLRLYADVPDTRELDEEATAERIAEDELWVLVSRPVRERRLRLLLLVDAHWSMALWQDTVRGLRSLLEQTAAFRSLTVTSVDLTGPGPAARGGGASPGPDSLVLVVTDGVAEAWRDGRAAAFLCSLAHTSPTAVLSLMPQELWEFTLPSAVRAGIDVPEAAVPNRRLRLRGPVLAADGLGDPVRRSPRDRPPVPVPVVEPTPGSLGRWARLVAADGGRFDAAVLLTGAHGDLGARRQLEPEPYAGRTRRRAADGARDPLKASHPGRTR